MISEEQKRYLLDYLDEFKENPVVVNAGTKQKYEQFDIKRVEAIHFLKEMINEFLTRKLSLKDFKERSEVICREYPYWGFKNFSGQMQLNQYNNNISDSTREAVLRNALVVPKNENEARNKINNIAKFISDARENTENPKSIPWSSQIYLLSYFWEIQDFSKWPVYYGSAKKVLTKLGFKLDVLETYGDEYLEYLNIMNDIYRFYKNECGVNEKYSYWYIEHILWVQFNNAGVEDSNKDKQEKKQKLQSKKVINKEVYGDWLPPIVNDLVDIASNKDTKWTQAKNLRPEKAFETKLRYVFTLLGYETKELGQGTGREPDGVAISIGIQEGDYAIVYDAKARENKFSIGTGDREIVEYIIKKKEELRKKRINKLYFLIVSSDFDDSAVNINLIREVFRRTQVQVVLLRASDLLFIIDLKLQDIEIDHTRLEYLFLDTGFLTREKISEILGIK